MDAFLQLSPADQRAYCQEGGTRRSLSAASMEKDFWVCWTLRELFALPAIGPRLTFKGGTSLSKSHGLIARFSEDIDLVIDRSAFDVRPADEPGLGGNERDRRLAALKAAGRAYIHDVLRPAVRQRLQEKMPAGRPWTLTEEDSPDDSIALLFRYPTAFATHGGLNPVVKIEPGVRSDIEPNSSPDVQPYLAEFFPDVLGPSRFAVRAVAPERTFWEKAMLPHEINAEGKAPGPASARHYYDLFCLIRTGVGAKALADRALFAAVHAHRRVFFRKARTVQETRRPGSFRLMPADSHQAAWRDGYEKMRESYFFRTPPAYDEILRAVGEFEQQLNAPSPATE
jgi:hypothetical protein